MEEKILPSIGLAFKGDSDSLDSTVLELIASDPWFDNQSIPMFKNLLTFKFNMLGKDAQQSLGKAYNRSLQTSKRRSVGMSVFYKTRNVKGHKVTISVIARNKQNGERKLENKFKLFKSLL